MDQNLEQISAYLNVASVESLAEARRLIGKERKKIRGIPTRDPDQIADPDNLLALMTLSTGSNIGHWTYRTLLADKNGSNGDVLLIGDTRSQNNIGCQATTCALIAGLVLRGRSVHHTVTLAEVEAIGRDIGLTDAQAPNPEDAVEAILSTPHLAPYRRLIERSRLIVLNGEGSFYGRSLKGLAMCALAMAAKKLGPKVAIANHSADIEDPVMRQYVLAAYINMDLVDFREPISARNMRAVAPPVPHAALATSADAAFAHALDDVMPMTLPTALAAEFPDSVLKNIVRKNPVIVTGSSAIMRSDYQPIEVAAFYRLCERILSTGRAICLYAADVSDNRILRPLALKLNLPLVPSHRNVDDVLSLFAASSAIVSGRWHASILAACVGTPAILGNANFFKTSGLNEMMGTGLPMFDYSNLDRDSDTILQALDFIDAEGDRLRTATHEAAVRHASLAQGSFDRMSRLVES